MAADELLKDYLTDEQLAKQFNKSVRTLKRWRREGKAPPAFKHGNRLITHVEDAAAHLEAQREEARAMKTAVPRAGTAAQRLDFRSDRMSPSLVSPACPNQDRRPRREAAAAFASV